MFGQIGQGGCRVEQQGAGINVLGNGPVDLRRLAGIGQPFKHRVVCGLEVRILILADLERDVADQGGNHAVELLGREVLDGFIQQIVGSLGYDVLVELFTEQALEFLRQDISQGQTIHGGQLGTGLASHLGLLVATEQLLILGQ